MLTAHDLVKRYHVTLKDIGEWYARRILPEAVRIGGKLRFREEDIDLFEEYLRARLECKEAGIDPDGPDGPAPPVYSTGCAAFDPREAMARIRERDRHERSKTLAASAAPMPVEQPIAMPKLPVCDRETAE